MLKKVKSFTIHHGHFLQEEQYILTSTNKKYTTTRTAKQTRLRTGKKTDTRFQLNRKKQSHGTVLQKRLKLGHGEKLNG